MRKLVWQTATIVFFVGIAPQVVVAQATDSQAIAAAQSLVDDAGGLMDKKKFAEACPKLEQAAKLLPQGIGVRLELAECYIGLGRIASAQGQYLQAEALARAAKDSRAREAAAAAAKLKPKLATMTLNVPDELRQLEGISLTWDGYVWEPATWGTAIPVDMGKHELELKAPGWKTWKTEVTVEANGQASKQDVPMLEKLPPEPIKPTAPPLPVVVTQPSRTPLLLAGIGLSVVGLGVGVGFTLAATEKNKEGNALFEEIRFDRNVNEASCPATSNDSRCAELTSLDTRRDTFAAVGIAGFVVGGVAAAGTLVLALTGPSKNATPKKDALIIMPMPSGAIVSGTF